MTHHRRTNRSKVLSVIAVVLLLSIVGVVLVPALGGSSHGRPAAEVVRAFSMGASPSLDVAPNSAAPSIPARRIQHRVSLSILVDDISAARDAVLAVLEPTSGEYVEQSSIGTHDSRERAMITLRVDAARIDTVVSQIGSLGELLSESRRATDVTDQLVDLEARLRNERVVEAELRDLLASRPDAPLEDVLAVRRSLGEVRLEIERIEARRKQMSDRVALATIDVSITDQGFSQAEAGIGSVVSGAWAAGVDSFIASIAWIIRLAVGGAIAWTLLVIGGVVFWRVVGKKA